MTRHIGRPFMVGCVLVGMVSIFGVGAPSFRDVPPTIGAYTLRGGEWQVSVGVGFQLAVPASYLMGSISTTYGITNWFEVGIAGAYGVLSSPHSSYMAYGGHAMLRLAIGRSFDLGIPFGFSFLDSGAGIEFSHVLSGAVASLRIIGDLTVHAGVTLILSRVGFNVAPYAIVDFNLVPNLKLVFAPLSLTIGVWLRPLDFLDLELALAPLGLTMTGGVHLRF